MDYASVKNVINSSEKTVRQRTENYESAFFCRTNFHFCHSRPWYINKSSYIFAGFHLYWRLFLFHSVFTYVQPLISNWKINQFSETWRRIYLNLGYFINLFFFPPGATTPNGDCILQPSRGLKPPRLRRFLITHNDAPHSVGVLWTNDQSVAETSTWQHTTLTTDKYPCSGWDSNPQSQQASGQRPTP